MGEIGTARIIHSKSNVEDVVDVANDDLDEAKRSNRREHTPPTGFVVWLRDHGPSRIASIALTKIRCVRHPLGMIGGLGTGGSPSGWNFPISHPYNPLIKYLILYIPQSPNPPIPQSRSLWTSLRMGKK